MTPAEFGEHSRTYVSAYIKFADAKAGGVLAIASSAVGAVAFVAPTILEAVEKRGWLFAILMLVPLGACALAAFMTAWHALSALSPRTPPANNSMASFVDVAGMEQASYSDAVATATPSSLGLQYSRVNHTLSVIAKEKFGAIADSVFWTRILILSAYTAVLIYALVRPGAT